MVNTPIDTAALRESYKTFLAREPSIRFDLHDDVRIMLRALRAILNAEGQQTVSIERLHKWFIKVPGPGLVVDGKQTECLVGLRFKEES